MTENPTKEEEKDSQGTLDAAEGFLSSERDYVEDSLRKLFEVFYTRLNVHIKLKRTIIEQKDIVSIFGNIETLYVANSKLYSDLLGLRMTGRQELKEGLGKTMQDFIPYLKVYTDYIVKTKERNDKVEELKKGNKKFREFVKINELCAKKKLKTLLDAPVSRLPHYLQNMASVYKSCENEGTKDSDAAKDLLKAIVDIKKMTDEISTKCRDQKCRRLVGQLQKDVFNDKILLTAAHRLCVRHGTLKIIKNKQWQPHVFILCNDILAIGTVSSRWKSGEMVAVFPLIGLRILRTPVIEEALQEEGKFRFAVIPQNKNFTPNDSLAMGSVIICCEYDKEMEAWIEELEDTVDEEEHNLRPCNPVDLEKRLRREPTSPEGAAPTITITDPDKIAEIEEWKRLKETRVRNKVKTKPPPKQVQTNGTNEHTDHQQGGTTTTISSRPSVTKMAPPPPRSSASVTGPPPTAPALPPSSKRMSTVSSASPPVPPPRRPGRAPVPPNRTGPPPLPSQQSSTEVASSKTTESSATSSAPKPPPFTASTTTTTSTSTATVPRVNLLGQIANFNRDSTLKKVVKEDQPSASDLHSDSQGPQDVASLLQTTLANYRTYVQDESDHEESDDEEWDD